MARLLVPSRTVRLKVVVVCLAASTLACGGASPVSPSGAATTPGVLRTVTVEPSMMTADSVLVAAGDIATCAGSGAESTAQLLDRVPGSVLMLGDAVYPSGTTDRFESCYTPTWGRHLGRTLPTPGNHEWEVNRGAPYFTYFGPAAGPAGRGYYSYTAGAWHVLSLNSNIDAETGSAQFEWVRADLLAHPATCTLAYWHHPRFSSSVNGNTPRLRDLWRLLDESGVDVVLAGHDHNYERFAPQDAEGSPATNGIREFVVGTGGGVPYGLVALQPNSEVRSQDGWGVLKLTLRSGAYDWDFISVDGQRFWDAGSGRCVD